MPPVIKNLIIINVLMFLAQQVWAEWTYENLGLFYFDSPFFQPVQLVTHMFMHGSIAHIFFNMFALWMFGSVLENVWGPKRFLLYYFITGFGAVILHQVAGAFQLYEITGSVLTPENLGTYSQPQIETIRSIVSAPVVGASGAIFGVLAGFGLLFPNTLLYVYFLFPIKAKYFILIYIGIEIYMGFVNSPGDNVAHFAHLGGALFGFILIKIWGKDKRRFY
ncbi:MAG: rhomboid family intramembrane serine protease [Fimbriimonadaceae bacterium]|nr:rhomboid family intramembrane serine protease [Chitinophagales bacterium]